MIIRQAKGLIERDKLLKTAIFHLNKIREYSYYHSPALDILKTEGLINRDVALRLMFEVIDQAVIKPMAEETSPYFKE